MLQKGDMKNNLALQPGDVVVVPTKPVKDRRPVNAMGEVANSLLNILALVAIF
jgi:hypothetical protein